MNPLIYIAAAVIVTLILWFVTRNTNQSDEAQDGSNEQETINQPAVQVGARRRRNVRMGIQRHAEGARQLNARNDIEEDDDETINKDSKIGTKKLKKLQEKEEKKRQREMDALDREQRKKDQEEEDEKRKLEEEKNQKEQEKIEEEKRKEKEEKEQREHEEYLKLKEMFSVDEEGQQELSSDELSQNLLKEFVDYIKKKKVVLLEDLGSHFGLRTQEAIDRVQTMLKDEILTGVIDDRGKFIYISNEELKAVAKYIDQRGRVSISDLAQASNSLINLISDSVTVNG